MAGNPPNWGAFGIAPNQAFKPVGDPNRWGALDARTLPVGFGEVVSDQFLQAKTSDPYSRSWSLVGTVQLPGAIWVSLDAGAPLMEVWIDLYQGVGQATLVQRIALALTATAGLCQAQNWRNGGPYLESVSGFGPTDSLAQVRSFAAIGALVGHSIAAKVTYHRLGVIATPTLAVTTAIVTPYAAGEGL